MGAATIVVYGFGLHDATQIEKDIRKVLVRSSIAFTALHASCTRFLEVERRPGNSFHSMIRVKPQVNVALRDVGLKQATFEALGALRTRSV